MKVLAIIGSRNPAGKTAGAVEAFFKGVEEKNSQTEKIFLTEKKIERCRQCDISGWGKCRTEGICIIDDDFHSVVDRIRQAHSIVFATPVYFSDISESMKTFLDRLRRITRNEKATVNISGKPAIGICVAGGGGGGAVLCSFLLERTLSTCAFIVVDMIPCRRQNLHLKQQVLGLTGKWLVDHISNGSYKQ